MRIGIVGCGSIAATHAMCISKIQGLELTAYADSKLSRAEGFVGEYGGRAYSSMEEMLEKEKLDAVHICTPHYLHTPMAICGLSHDVHVFLEKPPVITGEQLVKLKEAVGASKKQLGLCLQNRYNPSVVKAKELIESGQAGKVLGARGIVTWNREEEYYTQSDWRGRLETEGGGVLINQSVHTLDLLHYLVNEPARSIDAVIANHHLKGVIEVEDMMSAYIRYPEAVVCFYATTAYNTDSAPIIEVNCEHMVIRIEDLNITLYHKNKEPERLSMEGKKGYGKGYWGAGHEDCIRDFYNSIGRDQEFGLSLSRVEGTILLMLGAYEAARTGKEIWFNGI